MRGVTSNYLWNLILCFMGNMWDCSPISPIFELKRYQANDMYRIGFKLVDLLRYDTLFKDVGPYPLSNLYKGSY